MKSKVIEASVGEFCVKFHAELVDDGIVYHNVNIYRYDEVVLELGNSAYTELLQTINDASSQTIEWAFALRGETK